MKNKIHDYLFVDNESGEEFFIECETLEEAWDICRREFGKYHTSEYIEYYDVYEQWEADIMGYDTF